MIDDRQQQNEYDFLNRQPGALQPVPFDPQTLPGLIADLTPTPQTQTNVIRKKFSDFSKAATSNDVTLFSLPKHCIILTIAANVTQAFAGAAIATYTISVGKSGSSTGLLTAQSVTTTGFKNAVGTDFTTNRPMYSVTGPTSIVATATSTGANLSVATAGSIDFYVVYYSFPQL
jgi:hypothetical protein